MSSSSTNLAPRKLDSMVKNYLFKLKNFAHFLSVRSAVCCILAIAASLLSVKFDGYVPEEFADIAGGNAVDGILTLMASSMLIVLTFSLSSMVAAYGTVSQNSTPQATILIKDDSRTHSAISIFMGAFIYSVVSMIALSTGYYGKEGRVILLLITIAVLSSVVWIIIRWVDELKNMASVSESIARVETRTALALEERVRRPSFGCNTLGVLPENVISIHSNSIGYLQNIDVTYLGKLADQVGMKIYIVQDAGAYVHLKSALVALQCPEVPTGIEDKILKAFTIGKARTFTSDPIYGVSVLSGIGIKAMSPSLNDPGTAIDVVSTLVRILLVWNCQDQDLKPHVPEFRNVYFPVMNIEDVVHASFYNLVAQSTGSVQVLEAIKSGLTVLIKSSDSLRRAAETQLHLLELRAAESISLEADLVRVLKKTKP